MKIHTYNIYFVVYISLFSFKFTNYFASNNNLHMYLQIVFCVKQQSASNTITVLETITLFLLTLTPIREKYHKGFGNGLMLDYSKNCR